MASRSPTAVTPGPKSSAPETPATNDAPATPQAVPFPPPQTFDFIPPLHGVVLRLLSPQTNGEGGANAGNDGAAGPDQSQSQQQQPSGSAVGNNNAELLGASHTSADITALGSNLSPPLDVKNLPTEVSSIKIRIQKAQAVVEGLPDVDRTVAEQEKEIHDLEDRITRLKSVIADFGKRANNVSVEKAKAPGP
ncbi:RNA polymerase II mediator complex middle subunit MED9 [Aspergillus undulatus]|uniref:RNA polymerase II mediator complex middle subunit MED9 n=1 Tax=Aspergillus undulatus TaxID=1810928 RepID=UPI003CCDD9F1